MTIKSPVPPRGVASPPPTAQPTVIHRVDATDILGRLDLVHIAQAATWAHEQLARHGVAVVTLTPGDATRYPIVITWRPCWTAGGVVAPREYMVCLAGGECYPWAGERVTAGYCAEKWARGQEWTGVVVAAFLSAIVDAQEGPA